MNNAGGGKPIQLLDCTIDDLEPMLDVNTKAPFNITQKALPAITKSKGERHFLYCFGQQIHVFWFRKSHFNSCLLCRSNCLCIIISPVETCKYCFVKLEWVSLAQDNLALHKWHYIIWHYINDRPFSCPLIYKDTFENVLHSTMLVKTKLIFYLARHI